ncbi:hypothetical protein DL770_011577 [Monosporascus sp. CRB-9-2]|nr:hypothetical protein DL770_011577 [Monosporascus sp. CRB-9-2]
MATLFCLLLAAIAASGEYSSNCGRPTLLLHDDAPLLGSLCHRGPKGTQCTELDIGRCYRNKVETTINTCKDCSLNGESQTTLSCYCFADPAGSTYHYTEIDTDKGIENENGYFDLLRQRAESVPTGGRTFSAATPTHTYDGSIITGL